MHAMRMPNRNCVKTNQIGQYTLKINYIIVIIVTRVVYVCVFVSGRVRRASGSVCQFGEVIKGPMT